MTIKENQSLACYHAMAQYVARRVYKNGPLLYLVMLKCGEDSCLIADST